MIGGRRALSRAAEIKRKEKWETVYTEEMLERKVARGTDDRVRVEEARAVLQTQREAGFEFGH
jgi:hypothetical protein